MIQLQICHDKSFPSLIQFKNIHKSLKYISGVSIQSEQSSYDAMVTNNLAKAIEFNKPTLYTGLNFQACNDLITPSLTLRFRPDIAEIRKNIADGAIGKPGLVRIHHWDDPAVAFETRVAVEYLEICFEIFGAHPVKSHFMMSHKINKVIHLGFPCGGMGIIDLGHKGQKNQTYYSMTIIGSDGAIYSDDHRNRNLIFHNTKSFAEPPDFGEAETLNLLTDFIGNIRAIPKNIERQKNISQAMQILNLNDE